MDLGVETIGFCSWLRWSLKLDQLDFAVCIMTGFNLPDESFYLIQSMPPPTISTRRLNKKHILDRI